MSARALKKLHSDKFNIPTQDVDDEEEEEIVERSRTSGNAFDLVFNNVVVK